MKQPYSIPQLFVEILAGPLILWRLMCAFRRAGKILDTEKSFKSLWLIARPAGVLVLGLTAMVVIVISSNKQVNKASSVRFEKFSDRLMRTDLDAFIAAEWADEKIDFKVRDEITT